MPIPPLNPMFYLLFNSSRRDDTKKWPCIGFGEDITHCQLVSIEPLEITIEQTALIRPGVPLQYNKGISVPVLRLELTTHRSRDGRNTTERINIRGAMLAMLQYHISF